MAFLSGIILFFFGERKHRGYLPLILSIVSIYPIIAAAERGVVLAIVITLVALFLVSQRKFRYIGYSLLGLILVVGVFQIISRYGGLSRFIIDRFSISNIIESGGSGRTEIWKAGWQIVLNNPVIGVGLGNFTAVFHRYAYAVDPLVSLSGSSPHNDLLGVTAELGLVGLVLFLGFLGYLGILIY